jgi:hypothetical protein
MPRLFAGCPTGAERRVIQSSIESECILDDRRQVGGNKIALGIVTPMLPNAPITGPIVHVDEQANLRRLIEIGQIVDVKIFSGDIEKFPGGEIPAELMAVKNPSNQGVDLHVHAHDLILDAAASVRISRQTIAKE